MTQQQQPHYVHRIEYSTQERIVGLFVLAALAIIIGLIVAKGQTTNFFANRITFHSTLENAQQVSTDTPVQVSGIEVGRVSSLGLSEDNDIHVEFFVYERFRDLIREDSEGSLGKLSMLGNAKLNIAAGSQDREALPEGAEIPIEEPQSIDDLIAQAQPVLDSMRQTIDETSKLVTAIDEKRVGQATDDIAATAAEVRHITEDIAAGNGTVGALVSDPAMQQRFERTTGTLATTTELAASRLRELKPITQDAQAAMSSLNDSSARLPSLIDNVDQLVTASNRTVVLANERLESLPALTSQAEVLLGEAHRTIEGAQRIWPLSKALEESTQPTLIKPQPAQE